MPLTVPELEKLHATLDNARDAILAVHGHLSGLSIDTVFALGETAGQITKTKAMIGREIDDRRAKSAP